MMDIEDEWWTKPTGPDSTEPSESLAKHVIHNKLLHADSDSILLCRTELPLGRLRAWGSDSGSSQSQSGWQAVWVLVMWDRALEIEFLGLLVYMSA